MSDREEHRIIKRVCEGNRQEYARLIELYKTPLFNLAYRMTGNYSDAEDLTQEAFVRAYENLAGFDRNRSCFTWLYTIGLNLIRNHLKKERKNATCDLYENSGGGNFENREQGAADNQMMNEENVNTLHNALLQLAADNREAIILRFQQGFSFEDIAGVSGISTSAAKMRVYRGLERLLEIMEGKG